MPEDLRTWVCRWRSARRRGIVADFLRGLCVVGIARKYGRTVVQIERVLRRAM